MISPTESEYQLFRELARQELGLDWTRDRKYLLETRLGPPPFLPSDEAAIRGVKTNPRRTRTSRAVVHPDTFEREDLSAPRCPRSQRTAQTAMDGGAYWPSLIITTF